MVRRSARPRSSRLGRSCMVSRLDTSWRARSCSRISSGVMSSAWASAATAAPELAALRVRAGDVDEHPALPPYGATSCRARLPGTGPRAVPAVPPRCRQTLSDRPTSRQASWCRAASHRAACRNAARGTRRPLQPQQCFTSRSARRACGALLTLEPNRPCSQHSTQPSDRPPGRQTNDGLSRPKDETASRAARRRSFHGHAAIPRTPVSAAPAGLTARARPKARPRSTRQTSTTEDPNLPRRPRARR